MSRAIENSRERDMRTEKARWIDEEEEERRERSQRKERPLNMHTT